jgi:3-hydroxypropanoate dehydrogenase
MLSANQPKSPAAENSMTGELDDPVLDRLFRAARTRNGWTEQPVTEQQLRELYDLMRFGPTSGNCCPARFVWVTSTEGKSRLAALAAPLNAAKILAAPVTVIIGYDLDFAEQLPKLFPARGKEMQAYYSDPLLAQTTAFRNSSFQGAYLIITARALGLDCGRCPASTTRWWIPNSLAIHASSRILSAQSATDRMKTFSLVTRD